LCAVVVKNLQKLTGWLIVTGRKKAYMAGNFIGFNDYDEFMARDYIFFRFNLICIISFQE